MSRIKKTITKNISNQPIKWIVHHPQGHIYVLPTLEGIISRYGEDYSRLELQGWKFEPILPTE